MKTMTKMIRVKIMKLKRHTAVKPSSKSSSRVIMITTFTTQIDC